jgi:hypothetical protein
VQDRVADTYRRLGFAVVAAVPTSGILRGRGAVVSFNDGPPESRVVASEAGQYVSLEPERFDFANFFRASYPSSKMGAVAMVRQGFLDAAWWRDAEAAYELPTRPDEPYDSNFSSAGVMAKAGVNLAFTDGSNASFARNLPHQAAAAVAFGFPREKAVAAMTLEPARILGVADHVGSLEPGKDATLIVTDGDILDLRTRVLAAWLDGRPLDLTDKQKRLYERYRNRPKPVGR